MDEFMALAYHRQMGLPVTVVRLFNTVGARQSSRYGMVLPTMVRQALRGEDVTVHGDGSQTRCFTHVCDITEGLAALLENPASIGGIYNLGSTEEITDPRTGRARGARRRNPAAALSLCLTRRLTAQAMRTCSAACRISPARNVTWALLPAAGWRRSCRRRRLRAPPRHVRPGHPAPPEISSKGLSARSTVDLDFL